MNLYYVDVTYTARIWAEDAHTAEQWGVEEVEAGKWPVTTVDAYRKTHQPEEPQPHE